MYSLCYLLHQPIIACQYHKDNSCMVNTNTKKLYDQGGLLLLWRLTFNFLWKQCNAMLFLSNWLILIVDSSGLRIRMLLKALNIILDQPTACLTDYYAIAWAGWRQSSTVNDHLDLIVLIKQYSSRLLLANKYAVYTTAANAKNSTILVYIWHSGTSLFTSKDRVKDIGFIGSENLQPTQSFSLLQTSQVIITTLTLLRR